MTLIDAFTLFFVVFLISDTYLYSQGHDTFWWEHKTDAEKEIQKIKIERMKKK